VAADWLGYPPGSRGPEAPLPGAAESKRKKWRRPTSTGMSLEAWAKENGYDITSTENPEENSRSFLTDFLRHQGGTQGRFTYHPEARAGQKVRGHCEHRPCRVGTHHLLPHSAEREEALKCADAMVMDQCRHRPEDVMPISNFRMICYADPERCRRHTDAMWT
jgi:hypothetical protein